MLEEDEKVAKVTYFGLGWLGKVREKDHYFCCIYPLYFSLNGQ
jgi:hypothetical protein